MRSTDSSNASTSTLGPSSSTINSAAASLGYPTFTKSSAALMAGLSIISIPAGIMPAEITSDTALPASRADSKPTSIARWVDGLRKIRTVTSVTTPNKPSEPVKTPNKSSEPESRCLPPIRMTSPSMVTISTPSTLFVVRPYFKQCTPPEFSAILPPIEQAIWLEGSGA